MAYPMSRTTARVTLPGVTRTLALVAKNIETATAEVTMLPDPNMVVQIAGADAKSVLGLMETLEEHEDIQNVYGNFDISDEEMAKISAEE